MAHISSRSFPRRGISAVMSSWSSTPNDLMNHHMSVTSMWPGMFLICSCSQAWVSRGPFSASSGSSKG